MKRLMFLVVACVAWPFGVGVHDAHATLPQAISDHIADVGQWAYRGGTTSSYPACQTLCGDLWTAEHAPARTDPFAIELWREIELLRERIQVLPRIGSLLNERDLGTSPKTIGLKIGASPSRVIWLEVLLPGAVPWTPQVRGAAEPVKYVLRWYDARASIGGVTLPSEQWVIGGRFGTALALSQSFQDECGPGRAINGYLPPVGGKLMAAYGTGACWPQPGPTSPLWVQVLRSPVATPSLDWASQSAPTIITHPYYMDNPGTTTVQQRITTQLTTHAGLYRVLLPWLEHHLGGAAPDPLDPDTYFDRHNPTWNYDEDEDFFPQEASAFTDNWVPFEEDWILHNEYTNTMWDGIGDEEMNILAAAGSPGPPLYPQLLSLNFLGLIGSSSDPIEYLDARGDELSTYSDDSSAMRLAGHDDVVYPRLIRDPDDGKLWVQYWTFYYANSYNRFGFAVHEGDWEMVQVGLDETGQPDAMTYAIHEEAAGCAWSSAEHTGADGQSPVVYVGAGSHASYPHAGESPLPLDATDFHRGTGPASVLPLDSTGATEPWWDWRGRWGASVEGDFKSPLSPREQGDKWSHPSRFHSDHSGSVACTA